MTCRAIDVRHIRPWGADTLQGRVLDPCSDCLDDWCTMNCSGRVYKACRNCAYRHSGQKLCTVAPEFGTPQTEDGYYCDQWERAL